MITPRLRNICGIIIALGTSALSSCNYNNEEEKYPKPINQVICDTANVSFKNTIQPILSNNCYSCHSDANKANGNGYSFEGHSNIMSHGFINAKNAENSRLYRSVAHLSGAEPMPLNLPKLVECDINRIKAWINQGALDN